MVVEEGAVDVASRFEGVAGGFCPSLEEDVEVGVSSSAGTWGRFVPVVRGSKGVRIGS